MHNSFPSRLAVASITVDVVLFTVEDDQLKVLLVKRKGEPFAGLPALPGGFLWEEESTKQAAQRILFNKAGVRNAYTEQLYTFDDPKRDPRGHIVSVGYLSLVSRQDLIIQSLPHTQSPELYSVDSLPELAFDHQEIINYAVQRLRAKLEYTNVVYSLLPPTFPFKQLQKTYEIILNTTFDKRNFRKKFMSLGIIKPTGQQLAGKQHRPAELYMFTSSKPLDLERWF